jgi:hypothetical protein
MESSYTCGRPRFRVGSRMPPFEARELLLHSEGSRWRIELQPRHVVLYCIDPGGREGQQTVLISQQSVLDALKPETCVVLRQTRDAHNEGTAPVLTEDGNGERFSFRDLGDEPYFFESPCSGTAVRKAVLDLLSCCYGATEVFGWTWSRGDLLVIDNHRWFPTGGESHHVV